MSSYRTGGRSSGGASKLSSLSSRAGRSATSNLGRTSTDYSSRSSASSRNDYSSSRTSGGASSYSTKDYKTTPDYSSSDRFGKSDYSSPRATDRTSTSTRDYTRLPTRDTFKSEMSSRPSRESSVTKDYSSLSTTNRRSSLAPTDYSSTRRSSDYKTPETTSRSREPSVGRTTTSTTDYTSRRSAREPSADRSSTQDYGSSQKDTTTDRQSSVAPNDYKSSRRSSNYKKDLSSTSRLSTRDYSASRSSDATTNARDHGRRDNSATRSSLRDTKTDTSLSTRSREASTTRDYSSLSTRDRSSERRPSLAPTDYPPSARRSSDYKADISPRRSREPSTDRSSGLTSDYSSRRSVRDSSTDRTTTRDYGSLSSRRDSTFDVTSRRASGATESERRPSRDFDSSRTRDLDSVRTPDSSSSRRSREPSADRGSRTTDYGLSKYTGRGRDSKLASDYRSARDALKPSRKTETAAERRSSRDFGDYSSTRRESTDRNAQKTDYTSRYSARSRDPSTERASVRDYTTSRRDSSIGNDFTSRSSLATTDYPPSARRSSDYKADISPRRSREPSTDRSSGLTSDYSSRRSARDVETKSDYKSRYERDKSADLSRRRDSTLDSLKSQRESTTNNPATDYLKRGSRDASSELGRLGAESTKPPTNRTGPTVDSKTDSGLARDYKSRYNRDSSTDGLVKPSTTSDRYSRPDLKKSRGKETDQPRESISDKYESKSGLRGSDRENRLNDPDNSSTRPRDQELESKTEEKKKEESKTSASPFSISSYSIGLNIPKSIFDRKETDSEESYEDEDEDYEEDAEDLNTTNFTLDIKPKKLTAEVPTPEEKPKDAPASKSLTALTKPKDVNSTSKPKHNAAEPTNKTTDESDKSVTKKKPIPAKKPSSKPAVVDEDEELESDLVTDHTKTPKHEVRFKRPTEKKTTPSVPAKVAPSDVKPKSTERPKLTIKPAVADSKLPKSTTKPTESAKSPDSGTKPTTKKEPPVVPSKSAAKPASTSTKKPAKEDEEMDVELVGSPEEKKHEVKLKPSDEKPKTAAKPRVKKPKNDEEMDTDFVDGPTDRNHEVKFKTPAKKPSTKKPIAPDEEMDAELVGKPKDADHDVKFKPPAKKTTTDVKKPTTATKPIVPIKKPTSSTKKPPTDDDEMDTDLVNKPEDPNHDLKFKDQKPKTPTSKPTTATKKPAVSDKKRPTDAKQVATRPKEPSSDKKPTPDNEEMDTDLVDRPEDSKHDVKFKSPTEKKLAAKDSPPKEKTKPTSPAEDKTVHDEDDESEPEDVNADYTMKFDKPKKDEDPDSKNPKKKKSTKRRTPKPTEETSGPEEPGDVNADATVPLKKTPRRKKTTEPSDSVDEDERRPRKRRAKSRDEPKKERKRKPQDLEAPPAKPKWIPPPRPPADVYEMPPQEKSLVELLKEEKIAPTKRYAKKPKELETNIPFVVPWEQSPAKMTQEGMGAFGAKRNACMHIDEGHIKLKQGALKSENTLTLFEEGAKTGASRKGEHAFGSQRNNYGTIVDNHHYESDSKLKLCESVVPFINRGTLQDQSNMSAMGNLRRQTTKVEYGHNLKPGIDPESHKFLSRQFKSNSSEVAGSNVMDRQRRTITHMTDGREVKFDRASEAVVSRMFSIDNIEQRKGADFGSFRPLIQEVEGDLRNLTFEEEQRIKFIIPYQTAPSRR